MNFPASASLKGMLLKGSPLFCGTMGVSLGGWYTNENANSVHNHLLSDGYQYKVVKANLSSKLVETITNSRAMMNLFKFENGKCVKTFFPGLTKISFNDPDSYDVSLDSYSAEMSTKKSGKGVGCILMESDITINKNLNVVKSELAFKRGDRGFILGTGFLDKESGDDSKKEHLTYSLIYLEKKNESGNVVSGYHILGNISAEQSECVGLSLEKCDFVKDTIKSPDSSENGFEANNKPLNYAGIWEESSSGGKGIFEDIYGKPNKFTNSDIVSYFYNVSDSNKGIQASSGGMDVDSSQYLTKVLDISESIKGNGTDINSFCGDLSIRNLDLKDLCYEKTK